MVILKDDKINSLYQQISSTLVEFEQLQELLSDKKLPIDTWSDLYSKEFELAIFLVGAIEDLTKMLDRATTNENEFVIRRYKKELNNKLERLERKT